MSLTFRRAFTILQVVMLLAVGFSGAPRPVAAQEMVGALTVTYLGDLADDVLTSTCTLRRAIEAANRGTAYKGCPFSSTISLVPGEIYRLSVKRTALTPGGLQTEENDNLRGDLDIKNSLTIVGNGATILADESQGFNDRILHIHTTKQVVITNLTITGARLERYYWSYGGNVGGAILNGEGASLTLREVVIFHNSIDLDADESLGGGIANMTNGKLYIIDSTIEENSAKSGGGIYNAGTLVMRGSLVHNNNAELGGGIRTLPILSSFSQNFIVNSTISGNNSDAGTEPNGAAIHVGSNSTVELVHVTVAKNGNLGNKVALWLQTETSVFKMRNSLLVENGISCGVDENITAKFISYGYNRIDEVGRCNFEDQGGDTDQAVARNDLGSVIGALDFHGGKTKSYTLYDGVNFAIGKIPLEKCDRMDQRWFAREVDGSTHCDVGAFELNGAGPPLEDLKLFLSFITR